MRKLTKRDVEFVLTAEFDDLPVRGNAMASGDDALDKKVEDEIIARLERGDVWAWAAVTVEARWQGFVGRDHLGACCYRDERDFKHSEGYYPDMCSVALDDLNRKIQETADKLKSLQEVQS